MDRSRFWGLFSFSLVLGMLSTSTVFGWVAKLIGFYFVGSEQHLVKTLAHFGNKLALVLSSISKECRQRPLQLLLRLPRQMHWCVPLHPLRFLSKYLVLLYWKPNSVLHQKSIIGKKLQSRQVCSSLSFRLIYSLMSPFVLYRYIHFYFLFYIWVILFCGFVVFVLFLVVGTSSFISSVRSGWSVVTWNGSGCDNW
jgi:hypothetical protein